MRIPDPFREFGEHFRIAQARIGIATQPIQGQRKLVSAGQRQPVPRFVRTLFRLLNQHPRTLDLAQVPTDDRENSHSTGRPIYVGCNDIWSRIGPERLLEKRPGVWQGALIHARLPQDKAAERHVRHSTRISRLFEVSLRSRSRGPELPTYEIGNNPRTIGGKTRSKVVNPCCELHSARGHCSRFLGGYASRNAQRKAIVGLQFQSLACGRDFAPLVRHRDRLAEMGNRLLESRAAQSLVASLAPPFDRDIVEPGLCEVMRDRFRLGLQIAQYLGRAAVERLSAALEQAVVGGVLDQRVLEAIVRLRAAALDDQKVGLGEPLQRRAQSGLVETGDRLEQRVGEIAPQHRAELRGLPRGAEPVEARGPRALRSPTASSVDDRPS